MILSYTCILCGPGSIKPLQQIRSSNIKVNTQQILQKALEVKSPLSETSADDVRSWALWVDLLQGGGFSVAEWGGWGRVMLSIWESAGCPEVKLRYRLARRVMSYHAPNKLATHTHTHRPLQQACIFHEESKNKYFIYVCNVNSIMHLLFDLLSFEAVWIRRSWNDGSASNHLAHQ